MFRAIAATAACLLTATVAPPASAAGDDVVGTCRYGYQSLPNSTDILLVVTAEAHASGPDVATTTSIVCVARTFYGDTVTARTSMPGADVYTTSAGKVRWSSPSLCVDAQAKFVTTGLGTVVVDKDGDCGVEFPL